MVREIGPSGAKFQALVWQTICMYGMHVQNVLNDPTRSSSAADLGIWPGFTLLWLILKYLAASTLIKQFLQ